MNKLLTYILPIVLTLTFSIGHAQNFHLKRLLEKRKGQQFNVPVKSHKDLNQFSETYHFVQKREVNGWQIIYTTPESLIRLIKDGVISEYQINFTPPALLNDTARAFVKVDSVFLGTAPLNQAYKGEGTIVGIIDTGIDFNHPDFQHADGSTRILHYWDQTLVDTNALFDPNRSSAFGYGQVWDSTDINSGNCLSMDTHLHGTHVAGTAAGNALGNGTQMGMAPEANLVIVENDFNHPNWGLSVAEACDYIFHIADSLNMPASINISLGTYFGSHDGNDIGSEYMEDLLDEKNGRLITCAVGNSGAWNAYHVGANVDTDTSFVWFQNNDNSAFGIPACYFDLWADTSDFENVMFAFGADNYDNFQLRGQTNFYSIQDVLNTDFEDSIMSFTGFKIGQFEIDASIEGDAYHIEFYMPEPDSNQYLYRFMTTGDGKYDLWAGAELGASSIITDPWIPTVAQMPAIAHYNYPDLEQSVISGWACSDQIIAVGYSRNVHTYLDVNGNPYTHNDVAVGELSNRSAKGPTRKGLTKPDVVAPGAVMLSAAPLAILADYSTNYPNTVTQGGLHLRYSGSSMASPVVAGIGALYLQKCNQANWSDFKRDLTQTATEDATTGSTPNMAWGYGRANGFRTLIAAEMSHHFSEDTVLCVDPIVLNLPPSDSVLWQDLSELNPYTVTSAGNYAAEYYLNGCKGTTDTIQITTGTPPTTPVISLNGVELTADSGPNYQWYLDGELIEGATSATYTATETGDYYCVVWNNTGCEATSNTINVIIANINETELSGISLFPNPTSKIVTVTGLQYFESIELISMNGKIIKSYRLKNTSSIQLDLNNLECGLYQVRITAPDKIHTLKLIKND